MQMFPFSTIANVVVMCVCVSLFICYAYTHDYVSLHNVFNQPYSIVYRHRDSHGQTRSFMGTYFHKGLSVTFLCHSIERIQL